MKKIFSLFVMMMFLLSTSFVLAQGNASDNMQNNVSDNQTAVPYQNMEQIQEQLQEGLDNASRLQEQLRNQIQNMTGELAQKQTTLRKSMAGVFVETGNVMVRSKLSMLDEIEGIANQFKTKLSNGKDAFVKVMPNVASEKAIEALRLNNCKAENNCTIELKEVGEGENAKVAYEMNSQREVKVFGLFKAQQKVRAQIDAETGELIDTKAPWWNMFSVKQKVDTTKQSSALNCPGADGYYDEDCPQVKEAIEKAFD